MKKILVDLSMWDPDEKRGIGEYCANLFGQFQKHDQDFELVVVLRKKLKHLSDNVSRNNRMKVVYAPYFVQPIFEQVVLPVILAIENPDVMHCPSNTGPLIRSKRLRVIVTVHDTVFISKDPSLIKPKSIRSKIGWMYRCTIFRKFIRKTFAVVSVSDFVKDQLISKYSFLLPSGVSTIYHGKNSTDFNKNLSSFNNKWLTITGDIEHKNLKGILKFFELIRKEFPLSTLDVVGTRRDYGIHKNVNFHGPIFSREDIDAFYKHCDGYINLSFHESFGMPLVDAMANGSLIVASSREGPPEICGNAAILVDPGRPEWEPTFRTIRSPSRTKGLRNFAKRRADKFSWETNYAQLEEIYIKALI